MSTQDTPDGIGGQTAGREDAIDLSSYLARIGYTGPLRPTPDVLAGLIERHMATIPFEAIDVMLGRGIDLSPEVGRWKTARQAAWRLLLRASEPSAPGARRDRLSGGTAPRPRPGP